MAEFILLNKAILNANGDFKLAIKNIDNIPDGNLPTPTRNLLNEFKEAVKEIEKQVVKADNQPNLTNQANSGNIDSLTKQISYLQNAIKNQSKDAPMLSTATKQEVDNLSEATPNLTQNSIKGDGFVTYPNSARQETAINQNFNIQEWVKNMSGVISDEWRANLTKLAKKHPEMFRSEADVFRVIKEIKDNPTHFFKNYDDDVALIGKQINDNKFANIGIVKNDGEIIHANKNKIKDLDRLQRRNKEMLTGTPLPATTRANNSMGGDLLQHFNDKTIPNQTIKEAENQANLAKDPTADAPSELYKAHRKAQLAKEQTATIDEAPSPKATTAKEQELVELAKTLGVYNENYSVERLSQRVKDKLETNAIVKEAELNAIDKIEALNSFKMANTGERIERKKILAQAEQELKEFAKSIGVSDEKLQNYSVKSINDLREQISGLSVYLSRTKNEKGEALANKYSKILVDIDSLNIDRAVNRAEQKEQYKALKEEAIAAVRELGGKPLHTVSLLAARHGKTDEFLTKNLITKDELNRARELLQKEQKIEPIKEFGVNYAEFYHDGKNAIQKLLTERQGQVAGAFEREELGDIDLVWGEVTDAIKHKGYGLSHILDKRVAEFMEQGLSKEEAEAKAIELINKLPDIIKNGEIEQNGGRFRIQKDNYVIGLTSEYKGEKRNWIITAFERGNPQSFTEADFKAKSDNLLTNPNKNSTPKEIKSQAQKVEQKAKQYAKWLSQADKMPPQAPDELYKAYNKAKKDLKPKK
ncbi:hypothetical protein [Campylobacter lanienae]|uniref:putative barnase/colicin E5 family endoribonuclease n=1 Tax=Campylobacter lanienae TaxID=75658 RepID=UPI00112FB365|nr:hypothetical protein [Campylobacter lanienae]